jgi:copper chaperone CopZ
METEKDKTRLALIGAVLAAVAASLCCLLPFIAAGLGIAGLAASAAFERWRPSLLMITFGLLVLGFYLAYRPGRREACDTGSLCARKPIRRWNRAMLWLAALVVVLFAGFPYYAGWFVGAAKTNHLQTGPLLTTRAAHVVLKIEGMDCPACAAGLQNNLRQTRGVLRADVSFQDRQASIDYDPAKVDPAHLVQVFSDAGFKAALSPPANN